MRKEIIEAENCEAESTLRVRRREFDGGKKTTQRVEVESTRKRRRRWRKRRSRVRGVRGAGRILCEKQEEEEEDEEEEEEGEEDEVVEPNEGSMRRKTSGICESQHEPIGERWEAG